MQTTLNPKWEEHFIFENLVDPILKVRVWDYDSIGKDDFMGKLNIELGRFFQQPFLAEEVEMTLLKSKKRKSKVKGTLTLKIEFR